MEHSCSICSLKLATRAGLARHKLIHSGEKRKWIRDDFCNMKRIESLNLILPFSGFLPQHSSVSIVNANTDNEVI